MGWGGEIEQLIRHNYSVTILYVLVIAEIFNMGAPEYIYFLVTGRDESVPNQIITCLNGSKFKNMAKQQQEKAANSLTNVFLLILILFRTGGYFYCHKYIVVYP